MCTLSVPYGQMHFEMCQILILAIIIDTKEEEESEDTIVSHGIQRILEDFIARVACATHKYIHIYHIDKALGGPPPGLDTYGHT